MTVTVTVTGLVAVRVTGLVAVTGARPLPPSHCHDHRHCHDHCHCHCHDHQDPDPAQKLLQSSCKSAAPGPAPACASVSVQRVREHPSPNPPQAVHPSSCESAAPRPCSRSRVRQRAAFACGVCAAGGRGPLVQFSTSTLEISLRVNRAERPQLCFSSTPSFAKLARRGEQNMCS